MWKVLAKATLILRVRRAEPRQRRASPAVVYITSASAGNSVAAKSSRSSVASDHFASAIARAKKLKALTEATQVLVLETGASEGTHILTVMGTFICERRKRSLTKLLCSMIHWTGGRRCSKTLPTPSQTTTSHCLGSSLRGPARSFSSLRRAPPRKTHTLCSRKVQLRFWRQRLSSKVSTL